MKKVYYTALIVSTMLWGFLLFFCLQIFVQAQEEPQVVYDFMEITEDTPVYQSPDYDKKQDFTIPQGETVLVISRTADGWYQILYHEEIFYIDGKKESMEEVEISGEVIEEMEQNKENQNLEEGSAQDSNTSFAIDYKKDEDNKKTQFFSKLLLEIVAFTVLLSGSGYLYISKKENIEQAKRRKQAEIEGNGERSNQ